MVKVISISNEAYESLKQIKGQTESFSDVILKLLKKKGNIMELFGCAKEDREFIKGLKKAEQQRDKNELRNF